MRARKTNGTELENSGICSRKPFLESGFVPKRPFLDCLRLDFCAPVAAVQPDPFVLPRNRDERSPSWPFSVHWVFPSDIVVGLAIAVSEIVSRALGDKTLRAVAYKCNRAGYN